MAFPRFYRALAFGDLRISIFKAFYELISLLLDET